MQKRTSINSDLSTSVCGEHEKKEELALPSGTLSFAASLRAVCPYAVVFS